MIALATLDDLKAYKYVHDSVKNSTSFPQFVVEAQIFDVKKWLGDALLYELVSQAATSPESFSADNAKLLDGGMYTYQNRTYLFAGLRACIIYYAFARFTNRTSFNYTAAGIVLKESDFSNPATTKDIQRLETEARLMADAIKCEVMDYLNRSGVDVYPLWYESTYCRCGCGCSDNRPFKILGD